MTPDTKLLLSIIIVIAIGVAVHIVAIHRKLTAYQRSMQVMLNDRLASLLAAVRQHEAQDDKNHQEVRQLILECTKYLAATAEKVK
jgi:hypothetical protein